MKLTLKYRKPVTPGQRHAVRRVARGRVGEQRVPKSLREIQKKHAGRNHSGRITVRHQGGGFKRFVRRIGRETRRTQGRRTGTRASRGRYHGRLIGIQYDPNRTARLGLVQRTRNGQVYHYYMLRTEGRQVGHEVTVVPGMAEPQDLQPGNTRRLGAIPVGSRVSDLKRRDMDVNSRESGLTSVRTVGTRRRSRYVRTAGAAAVVLRKREHAVVLRLPSGTRLQVPNEAMATRGRRAGEEHRLEVVGKAGRNRNRGIRPTVRGEVMNPVDHPHGGRTRGGGPEKTLWSRLAKGVPTRDGKKRSKWVVTE